LADFNESPISNGMKVCPMGARLIGVERQLDALTNTF
jgi:hypothetical protein